MELARKETQSPLKSGILPLKRLKFKWGTNDTPITKYTKWMQMFTILYLWATPRTPEKFTLLPVHLFSEETSEEEAV